MNIIRLYKLHKTFGNFLTEKELDDLNLIFQYVNYSKENYTQIDFIYNNFFNLKVFKHDLYPNSIFYFKENNVIFEYLYPNESIWTNNKIYIPILKITLQNILKIYYNLKITHIGIIPEHIINNIEHNYYKYGTYKIS